MNYCIFKGLKFLTACFDLAATAPLKGWTQFSDLLCLRGDSCCPLTHRKTISPPFPCSQPFPGRTPCKPPPAAPPLPGGWPSVRTAAWQGSRSSQGPLSSASRPGTRWQHPIFNLGCPGALLVGLLGREMEFGWTVSLGAAGD